MAANQDFRWTNTRTLQDRTTPFLRLPPELRNRIYEYTLSFWLLGILNPWKPRTYVDKWYTDCNLSILSTCRQIYAEAKLLPFRVDVFAGWPYDFNTHLFPKLKSWQVDAITTIHIRILFDHSWGGDPSSNWPSPRLQSFLQRTRHISGLKHLQMIAESRYYMIEEERKSQEQLMEECVNSARATDVDVRIVWLMPGRQHRGNTLAQRNELFISAVRSWSVH
jgi:hypothetical protein